MRADLKDEIRARVVRATNTLRTLADAIHTHPELAFEEHRAAAWAAEALAEAGYDVTSGVADLPTALSAEAGEGDLTIAVCAEYDALPGIGHACGHNLIAATAVGTAIALRPFLDDLGIRLRVLGTPAEEGGAGKQLMLDRGAFDGVDIAMMTHPAAFDSPAMNALALTHWDVEYHGREAHASLDPEAGINAADAATVAQVAIGLARQHLSGDQQVHGILTDGGESPNIVPAYTRAKYYLRAATQESIGALETRIERCLRAGAVATGATIDVSAASPRYEPFRNDERLMRHWTANAQRLGRDGPTDWPAATSTDMGNVSQVIPSLHAVLDLGCGPVSNHQPEFAAAATGPRAEALVHDGSIGLAWTACDLAPAR